MNKNCFQKLKGKQECIPVGCIPPACNHTGDLPDRNPPWMNPPPP